MNKATNTEPGIFEGAAIFSGTKVSVRKFFEYLESGQSVEDFLEDFTEVKREQVTKLLELSEQLIQSHAENNS